MSVAICDYYHGEAALESGESVTSSLVLSNLLSEHDYMNLFVVMWLEHANLLQNLELWIPVIT